MAHHIFQSENELQNIPEAAPSSRRFSVSERLARYGSSSLSGVEHLRLLVGKVSIADALLRHFGSLKALSRASFKELRQFLPKGKAEAVMAALSVSNVVEAEHALSAPLNNAEAIYRANMDMKGFHQEVVRVVLLDAPEPLHHEGSHFSQRVAFGLGSDVRHGVTHPAAQDRAHQARRCGCSDSSN
jgi:DNA repair protein RadC